MFLVTIGTTANAENISETINIQLEELKSENADVIYESYFVGNTCFVKCGIKDNILTRLTDKKQHDDFKINMSRILTDSIIQHWEPRLIKRILKDNFFYLNEKEKEKVLEITDRLLQEEKPILPGGFYKITRRNKIMKCVLEYFAANEELNIDGFVNFRLGSYIKELNDTIERAIEQYVAEREYNEFIKLLKYFVDIQECKVETVHLKQAEDGKYIMLDEDMNSVSAEYFDEIKSELADENINYDDLLISTLITISPRRIYLHEADNFKNKELLKTIKSVFADRIYICSGCELCRIGKVENRESNNYGL